MKGNQVSVANVSVVAVGVLCGSFRGSGWVEILNLLNASTYTGGLSFFFNAFSTLPQNPQEFPTICR